MSLETPEGPLQDVARVVAGVQDGLCEEVTDVGDGGVGEQISAQPVRACRAAAVGRGVNIIWYTAGFSRRKIEER